MAPSGPTTHGAVPLRVAEIFRRHGEDYRRANVLGPSQLRVLAALSCCRTAHLGGHIEHCVACGHAHPVYNSCRDRHCPSCQAHAQRDWIAEREQRILPVRHFHVVFTLPSELRALARSDPRAVYDLLFAAASETLLTLGRDRLGGTLGITMVLHTWTRELLFHPHVHCVVTAGALTDDGGWVASAPRFLFPVAVMRKLFRSIVRSGLRRRFDAGRLRVPQDLADPRAFRALLRSLHRKSWVVYAKAPLAGAHHVFRYLGRYTHRVGISDQRLTALSDREVTFRTRGSHRLTLPVHEFIRRFLLHVLPDHFHKIRHYGLYSGSAVRDRLAIARAVVRDLPTPPPPTPAPAPAPAPAPVPRPCPRCGAPLGRLPLDFAGDFGIPLLWPPRRAPVDTS